MVVLLHSHRNSLTKIVLQTYMGTATGQKPEHDRDESRVNLLCSATNSYYKDTQIVQNFSLGIKNKTVGGKVIYSTTLTVQHLQSNLL